MIGKNPAIIVALVKGIENGGEKYLDLLRQFERGEILVEDFRTRLLEKSRF